MVGQSYSAQFCKTYLYKEIVKKQLEQSDFSALARELMTTRKL